MSRNRFRRYANSSCFLTEELTISLSLQHKKTPAFDKSLKRIGIVIKLSLKYKRNILWQRRYTQNGIWLEIDINLNSWECIVNHKIFISWLKVEIYRFIRGSCLEKVSVFFFFLLIYFPSYFFYKVAHSK